MEDRIRQVAQEITNYLKYSDRMQKTIVFCQSEEHAERMRVALVNLNQDMVRENPDYVVRITGSDDYGKSKLSYFISVGTPYPVIATTSKLLSTGVDCKMTKLIVLDQMIGSMTEFKQIIGRGTRIREQDGKLYFELMDFRGNVRHFADPDWDGTPEKPDPNYPPKPKPTNPTPPPPPPEKPDPPEKPKKYIVTRSGCRVETWGKVVAIYDPHGKLLRQENIIDYTKTNVLGQFASLEKFIQRWNSAEKKESIRDLLRLEFGIDLEALKAEQNMTDVDDFDFLCHIAFDKKPLTRRERANNVKKRDFLSRYSGTARDVLETLLEMYMNEGIYELDSPTDVLKLPIFQRFGTPSRIAVYFGGRDGYLRAVRELENELYNAGYNGSP